MNNFINLINTDFLSSIIDMHKKDIIGDSTDNKQITKNISVLVDDYAPDKVKAKIIEQLFVKEGFIVKDASKVNGYAIFACLDIKGRMKGDIKMIRRYNG